MKVDKRYWDVARAPRERARILVGNMTLAEKIGQMGHQAPAIARLKVPAYTWWNECLHGVARAGLATVFPQSIGCAATFDTALEKRVTTAVSDEARAKYNAFVKKGNTGLYSGLTFWSPNINIFRDPRWGRGQETFGEDPYLTARMGVAYVKGLQGNHRKYVKVSACAKHYAVHSGPEMGRGAFDSVVGQRDLRETYLPAFQALVEEAKVESVMSAYNRVNGEACSCSPTLLEKILRGEWGFEGHVVSDCGAVENIKNEHKLAATECEAAAMAVNAGCDLCCGGIYETLVSAVMKGHITEETITRSVERLFTTRIRLGLFDPPKDVPWTTLGLDVVASAKHRAIALEAAEKSIVLLKNDGILPLDNAKVKSIGVVGPLANDATCLLGNYNGFAVGETTYRSGIVGAAGASVSVAYMKGCDLIGDFAMSPDMMRWQLSPCDVLVACVGNTADIEGEAGDAYNADAGGDRRSLKLPGQQQVWLEGLATLGKPIVLVVSGGSAIDLSWAHEHCAAVLMAWYPGEAGGEAVGNILFGKANPSGRCPMTFPKSTDDLPEFASYAMKGRTYRYAEREPLYPFGHGLGYTTFAYSAIKLNKKTFTARDTIEVSVEVKNTGKRTGDEVVQLYVTDVEASVPVPKLHLEGFQRVTLKPRQKQRVTFTLTPSQLLAYRDDGTPLLEPGLFRLSLGGGQPSFAKTLTATVKLLV
ncbi:MAG: glycoside hydrolase family 3 C-terminal domain-containing protein [Kiritimatiellaeota bacterium]|nr:glycoside hydrolase family 3 C-terminal domain-containing protein [Kiritimatiellota bacterium]